MKKFRPPVRLQRITIKGSSNENARDLAGIFYFSTLNFKDTFSKAIRKV